MKIKSAKHQGKSLLVVFDLIFIIGGPSSFRVSDPAVTRIMRRRCARIFHLHTKKTHRQGYRSCFNTLCVGTGRCYSRCSATAVLALLLGAEILFM